jgi:hypothetical protein
VLAHDPASLSENFQEGNCLSVWGYQLTGSYAAVPANGPAANESQPHPLPGLRLLGGEQGPRKKQNPTERGFAVRERAYYTKRCASRLFGLLIRIIG